MPERRPPVKSGSPRHGVTTRNPGLRCSGIGGGLDPAYDLQVGELLQPSFRLILSIKVTRTEPNPRISMESTPDTFVCVITPLFVPERQMTEELNDEYVEGCPRVVFVVQRLLDTSDHTQHAQAVRMLEDSPDYNHPRVQFMLGYIAELGLGIPVDIHKAKTHYRNAMSEPYSSLQFNLAVEFSVRHQLETLKKMEVEWYERAVQLGSTDALWGLAHRLQRGEGCKRDYGRAMKLYTAAAAAGDPYAAEELGEEYCYRDIPDFALAAKYFEQAADQGFKKSQIEIGKMYWHGKGIQCCHKTALSWFRKAADQGSHQAFVELGMSLCEPRYDFYSPTEAFAYFCKALHSPGNDTVRIARWNLGLCYRDGEGVTMDSSGTRRNWRCYVP